MSIAFVQSVWTVIAMAVFIGIVIWAYSSHRKIEFDQASHIVQDDDRPVSAANNRPEE